jgi:hypothetical protein
MATLGFKRDIEMTMITSTQPSEPLLNKSLVYNNNNNDSSYSHEVVRSSFFFVLILINYLSI